MRLEVGAINTASRVGLTLAGLGCGYAMIQPCSGSDDGLAAFIEAHLAAGYALTLLSFASFPRTRRSDLVKTVILAAALAEIARIFVGYGFAPRNIIADAAGAFSVMVSSYLERFRQVARADPYEPFSIVYPGDRRRSARPAKAPGRRGNGLVADLS